MAIDSGKSALRSKLGALCSILIRVIVIAYTAYRLSIMEGKKSVDVLSVVQQDAISEDYVFSSAQGFNIAIAIIKSTDSKIAMDQSYGSLRVQKMKGYFEDDGNYKIEYVPLETHECSDEELGLTGQEHAFLPIKPALREYLDKIKD